MVLKKKIYFFFKERGSLWREILSHRKFIRPRRIKKSWGIALHLGKPNTESRSRLYILLASSEPSHSTSTNISLICKMEMQSGSSDGHYYWPVGSLKENLTAGSVALKTAVTLCHRVTMSLAMHGHGINENLQTGDSRDQAERGAAVFLPSGHLLHDLCPSFVTRSLKQKYN